MTLRVRVEADVRLSASELRPATWWYQAGQILSDAPPSGIGGLEVGVDVQLSSPDPAVWRAFAAAAAQVADELAALYAEHGVEPPRSES